MHLKGFEESFEAPLMTERGTAANSAEGRQMVRLTPSPQKLQNVSRTPTKFWKQMTLSLRSLTLSAKL
jgi:hypothetical protein